MITLENESVKVYVKSIVFDEEEYMHRLYWLTAVGTKVSLQGVFASLVNIEKEIGRAVKKGVRKNGKVSR